MLQVYFWYRMLQIKTKIDAVSLLCIKSDIVQKKTTQNIKSK